MLVAVWAVVLVPMWAHRQTTPSESEISPSARVISRRRQAESPAGGHSARAGSFRVGPVPSTYAAMLRRRRTVLLVLTGAVLGALAAVLIGFPAPLLALAALPYAGYLIWLRRTAAHAAARRAVLRRRVDGRRAASFRDFGDPTPAAADVAAAPATADQPAPTAMPTASVEADTGPDVTGVAGADTTPWLPVPLPLPSYVTAAPAPKVIDGDWHEEELLDGELPGEASAYALGEDALRRRAVGD